MIFVMLYTDRHTAMLILFYSFVKGVPTLLNSFKISMLVCQVLLIMFGVLLQGVY